MRMRLMTALGLSMVVGCMSGTEAPDPEDSSYGPFDFAENLGSAEKGDLVGSAHVLRSIDLNSRISGRFDPAIRVYGFTFDAKIGATVQVNIDAKPGRDSLDAAGTGLDTVAAIYGPMNGDAPGNRLLYVDDDDSGVAAQLPALRVPTDGRYLVVFSTWNDPGDGSYEVGLECSGTDFQCRRPVSERSCVPGTHYIVGGTRVGTTTWDRCDVVLLEETHVSAGEVLTIAPGVTVKGNYIGTGAYGNVRLVVDGALQAIGTEEQPVLFTSLKEEQGWGGVVLTGASSTLENVSIERARLGVELNGASNVLSHVVIDSGELGLRVNAGSSGNTADNLRITQIDSGIEILGGAITIEDTSIVGRGSRGTGIRGLRGQHSEFRRALVAGFADGLHLTSTVLEVYDSTIVNNDRGVTVTGDNAGLTPAYTCPGLPSVSVTPPSRPSPPTPTTWGRDPVFIRSDIVKNKEYAVRILAPELLVIESCNITDNGAGIEVRANSLHPDSRIRASNILRNGTGAQVDAAHINGTLDITGNYWEDISDPELSANWLTRHADRATCSLTNVRSRNAPTGNGWSCGGESSWDGSTYAWTCSQSLSLSWSSNVRFNGFSPEALLAGPDLRTCSGGVLQERMAQSLAN